MMKLTMFVLPVRIAQLIISLTVLGLSGYVANWYNVDTLTSSPSQVNFLIFCPLFSVLSIVYLEGAPRFMPKIAHPWIAVGLELLNVLFYFAGFIALAVFLNSLLFCRGTVCAAAKADTFFGALMWLLWTFTTAVSAMDVFKMGFRKPTRAAASMPYPKEMKETGAA